MTIHTGQTDLYKCRFCPKTYRFSSTLAVHRKKEHPNEKINGRSAVKEVSTFKS